MDRYIERRKKLFQTVNDNSVIIIGSGNAPMKSLDEAYAFYVDRNFYYLTGIDCENMILLMYKFDGKEVVKLFIERYDEYLAKWVGGRMMPEEARSISGIEQVDYIDQFQDSLCAIMEKNRWRNIDIYLDLWKNNKNQSPSFGHKQAEYIGSSYPQARICDIYMTLAKLRMIKDSYEIEAIKKAIELTGKALRVMMSYCKPGMNECEMEGVFDFELTRQGVREHAFKTIVASGKNGTVLHYSSNNCTARENELVLVDLGCTYDHYCADISRTFPAGLYFTDRQRVIYNIVLEAQKLVFKNAKPGVSIKELNDMVKEHYKKQLENIGLLGENGKVEDYYYHNISHHLGLDTHDMSWSNDMPLEPGMVITVEPGLYIAEEEIGIRIEDDILITEDKPVVLSAEIAKLPEHIELIKKQERPLTADMSDTDIF